MGAVVAQLALADDRFLVAAVAAGNIAQHVVPTILRGLGMLVAEERERAMGCDDIVEPSQRRRAVHPMKRSAHRDQAEGPHPGCEVIGPAAPQRQRHARRASRLACRLEHRRLRVGGGDTHSCRGERHREKARSRAEIEYRITRLQPGERDHALDEARRVRQSVAGIERDGALKSAGVGGHARQFGIRSRSVKPYAEACERNRGPILEVLRDHFADRRHVLEIGSGTGQHAVHFAAALPQLIWQTSDVDSNLPGIRLWLEEAGLPNLPPPIALDVTGPWPDERFDAIFTANTLHIMSWPEVRDLFAALPQVLTADAVLA